MTSNGERATTTTKVGGGGGREKKQKQSVPIFIKKNKAEGGAEREREGGKEGE